MPADDVPFGSLTRTCSNACFRKKLTQTEGPQHDGFSDPAVAKARLEQEAQEMKRYPLFGSKGVRDITVEFASASQQLVPGQLVKDEYFTLFEAVGALEIMDPKMDSGCIPLGDTFEPDFDVCKGLAPANTLWIMDEILRLEVSFHDGYPLSQNLFTSLHIMRLIHPDNDAPYHFRFDGALPKHVSSTEEIIVHIVLRAYCVAVIKGAQLALDVIQSYTYYEEEDSVTYLFGRDLLPNLSSADAVQILHQAVETLGRLRIPSELKAAFLERLTLREHLLVCLEDGSSEQWRRLLEEVESVNKSHTLTSVLAEAFSDKVQRQLATSTPPRPMPQLLWEDAHAKWLQLCQDVLATFDSTAPSLRQRPYSLQRAIFAFAYRQPIPTTLARAKMQEILMKHDSVAGEIPHFDLMLTDIRELILAGDPLGDPASFLIEVPSDPRHRASRVIEDFMQKAFVEYINIYRMFCQNRCRMRRNFTQAVPLFDDIETEAIEADLRLNEIVVPRSMLDSHGNILHMSPLTLWTRTYKLQIMEWIIQLGFETDLYLSCEMAEMYFTLQHIATVRQNSLLIIEAFTTERCRQLKVARQYREHDSCQESARFVKSLVLLSDITISISAALGELYALLERNVILDASEKRYQDHQLRYEARMKPFLAIVHDNVPDRETLSLQKMSGGSSVSDSCSNIDDRIKYAKSTLAELKTFSASEADYMGSEDRWRQDIKSLETVCVAVSVATSQLRRIAEKNGLARPGGGDRLEALVEAKIPRPGSRYHDWWVVPQIKSKR